ncbi:shikimate dehydrogenase [Candidatus Albibeggiatoa sp. nov. NOAA]|uniref:shikimate dehydrogenase n=1 Tax=Candidatus Albibeggiatoa sp. nov. NOAA TaxID=3162724 RepID=UPI003300FA28|nr:shikimate dehydrogenase [Thiotrichaceae bacterium]
MTIHHIDQYVVIGNPINHSKSPSIHSAFAYQTGQALDYKTMLVSTDEGEFAKAVQLFQQSGGKGLNITVPFKQHAWEIAQQRTSRAEHAGALNTLWFDEQGVIHGDNTDGVGLVRDLTANYQIALKDKKVLIMGAGGAVRGVLEPILAENPASCTIVNRTVSKAQALADLFQQQGNINAIGYDELQGEYDVIINGTSASLQSQLPPLPETGLILDNTVCYDMMYGATDTLFIQWAKQHGVPKTIDGLGMLVEQAAESFYLWRNVRPETASVIQKLRMDLLNENRPTEIGGPKGLEPTRYGDWERKGRCVDF